jgi:hypothetical protein
MVSIRIGAPRDGRQAFEEMQENLPRVDELANVLPPAIRAGAPDG